MFPFCCCCCDFLTYSNLRPYPSPVTCQNGVYYVNASEYGDHGFDSSDLVYFSNCSDAHAFSDSVSTPENAFIWDSLYLNQFGKVSIIDQSSSIINGELHTVTHYKKV